MGKSFKIEAQINLLREGGRKSPLPEVSLPEFSFVTSQKTMGEIRLKNKRNLNLGESAIADVYFASDSLLGQIKEGTEFEFYHGPKLVGNGKVFKVIGWIEI